MVNMVIWFIIIKKGKIVDPIGKLLASYLCKVLMITNTNVTLYMVVIELCVVDRIQKTFLKYLARSISVWEQVFKISWLARLSRTSE